MARGFGSTYGTGTTDVITTTNTTFGNTRSYFCLFWIGGLGGGSTGAVFRQGNQNQLAAGTGQMFFRQEWSGAATANWFIAPPPNNTWASLGISYDASAAANDPIMWLDLTKNTIGSGITEAVAPSGTIVSMTGNAITIGNNPGLTRNWDGVLAEFAVWSVILTDAEFTALAKRYSPSMIRPSALIQHEPMVRNNINTRGAASTVSGTVVQSHPRIIMSRSNTLGRLQGTAAAAFKSAWAGGTNLPVLGTGTF